MKKFTTVQFLNFALGFFGLQFAWQMRIILSGPVTENLGASPFIYGLIWLAGPFTGMVVQPIIGVLSDKTVSPLGRRRPYLLGGAIIASIALWIFPNSANLWIAALMIWIIDACINIAQGPYRALIPDVVPKQQHSIANSYISLAIGLGSVVAAGMAPFLKWAFGFQMSIPAQFIMGAVAFTLAMVWTCITIKESKQRKVEQANEALKQPSFLESLKGFFAMSPEVGKICVMQFFTWIGVMCMMIFFTQYAIHTVFGVPDLLNVVQQVKDRYEMAIVEATNFSSVCFAVFNLVCFLVAIPIGFLSTKFGNKKIHIICILTMIAAFLGMATAKNPGTVIALMGLSGIGWASICALPFAMLSQYIEKGKEGSVMGIFNIFIAGPQVFVCTLVAWYIGTQCTFIENIAAINYHWEYAFLIGANCLALAAAVAMRLQEHKQLK